MNITAEAYSAIVDAALRSGESHPLVRMSVTYPQKGQRLISTNFIKDFCVDSRRDLLEQHGDFCVIMDVESAKVLEHATLSVKKGHFAIRWPEERQDEVHRKSKRKSRRNRRR